MNKRYFVDFSVPRSEGERFKVYIREIGLIEFWQDPHNDRALPHMYHTLDANDPKLAALRALLKREGIKWSEREEHVYTDAELRLFPLLELSIGRRPLDEGGPTLGTTYELSKGCAVCGCGAVQTSPLMLGLAGLPKKGLVCASIFHEILVAESLALALCDATVGGLELRQARFYRNNEPLPWWQMIVEHDMPKLSPRTKGIITNETDFVEEDGSVIRAMPPCAVCRRDGRYHNDDVPYEITYCNNDVDPSSIPDLVRTWEAFGVSRIDREHPERSWFGEHRILVKPRVFDIFRKLKVKHARFVPVRFVD